MAATLALWEFAHAVFIPELLTDRIIELLPTISGTLGRTILLINLSAIYFAGYFAFSLQWRRLQPWLGNVFFGSLALFAINVLILFPIAGVGLLGGLLPQGYLLPCLFVFVEHWVFARALQIQERWRRSSEGEKPVGNTDEPAPEPPQT